MKNNPLISVVTISYNAVATIEQTILSVINQTYKNIEYIIIDGGSTDGTVDIIKRYSDRISYWISEPDKGIYDAMNKGVEKASGYWINFMNSGDTFYNRDTINDIFKLSDYKDIDILYGDRISVYSFGPLYQMPNQLRYMNQFFPIFHQSTFIKSDIMKDMKYDVKFKISADYNFFHKAYHKGCRFEYVNIPFSICDVEFGVSTSAKNQIARLKEDALLRNEMIGLNFHFKMLKIKIKRYLRKCYSIFDKTYNSPQKKRERLLKSDLFKPYKVK